MVSPDGTGSRRDRPQSGRGLLLAVVALVISGGFIALGALSPAAEEAVEATTTIPATTTTTLELAPPIDPENFDISQIETGEPLALVEAVAIDDAYPLAVIEHGGGFYTFATMSNDWLTELGGGLLVWRSPDGVSWETLGEVVSDDFHVTRVASSGEALLAVGFSVEDGTMMLWESTDGADWRASEVTTETDAPSTLTFPTAVGASGDVVVIAATAGDDVHRFIQEALVEAGYEYELRFLSWGIEWDPDGTGTVTLHGPLGIPVNEIEFEELDLTEEELRILEVGYDSTPDGAVLWTRHGSSGWEQGTIDSLYDVQSIVRAPDGALVASGWGNAGMLTARSIDGRNWEVAEPSGTMMWSVERWGDRFVGLGEVSVPEVMISPDGVAWEQAGLRSHLPTEIPWSGYSLASGDGGIALVVNGYIENGRPRLRVPISRQTDKGNLVTFDLARGRLTLEAGDVTHSWHIYGERPDDMLVDAGTRRIELLDSESGVSFGRFTFDELHDAEQDYYADESAYTEERALVYSPDAEEWVIQDLRATLAPESIITGLNVGADRLVAIVLPDGGWHRPMLEAGFEIWTAPLP